MIVRLGKACFSSSTPASVTRVPPIDTGKFAKPLEMDQPGVGDLSIAEVELGEIGQPSQVHQPGVGDAGVEEVQRGELR